MYCIVYLNVIPDMYSRAFGTRRENIFGKESHIYVALLQFIIMTDEIQTSCDYNFVV